MLAINEKDCIDKNLDKTSNFNLCLIIIIMSKLSKISIIDAQLAGLSGDMMLSALIDLGADKKKVIDSIYKCENILLGSKIKEARFEKINTNGFEATRFFFEYKEKI